MKVWTGFGSEHSMNLVMIGHFTEASNAEQAMRVIEELSAQVQQEELYDTSDSLPEARRYSDEMMELFRRIQIYSIRPVELGQFGYEFSVDVNGSDIVIRTDESDVSALFKVLVEKGAKIEIYSAHDHPSDE